MQKKIQMKEVLAELMAEHVALKKRDWGTLTGTLGPARYAGSDRGYRPALVGEDRDRAGRFIGWLDITANKLYNWRERYGKVNEHNGWVPRDFWLDDWRSRP